MIYLITAPVGCGKTLYMVNELKKIHDQNERNKLKDPDGSDPETYPVRRIYANIDGLQIPHEPTPDDWRDCVQPAVIVYDEAHKVEYFQPSRKALNTDPRVMALNEIRHGGNSLYLITQAPKFIHSHIRDLVVQHYHLYRPMGAKLATVFMWRHGNTLNPSSQRVQDLAESKTLFSYPKSIFKLYKSAEIHTHKLKIPKKLIFWFCLPLILLAVFLYLVSDKKNLGLLSKEGTEANAKEFMKNNKIQNDPLAPRSATTAVQNAQQTGGQSAAQAVNPINSNQPQVQPITYNPNNPFSTNDMTQYEQRDIIEKPIIAGCISTPKSCTCYTQQATRLEVSRKDCMKVISEGMPFNPFKNQIYQADSNAPAAQQQRPMPTPFDSLTPAPAV